MPTTPVQPPPGFIFEQIKAPLSYNYHDTAANPGKTGESLVHFLNIPFTYNFLSFTWEDPASVETASARE